MRAVKNEGKGREGGKDRRRLGLDFLYFLLVLLDAAALGVATVDSSALAAADTSSGLATEQLRSSLNAYKSVHWCNPTNANVKLTSLYFK